MKCRQKKSRSDTYLPGNSTKTKSNSQFVYRQIPAKESHSGINLAANSIKRKTPSFDRILL
jgi:hypothetical protein